MNSNENIYIDTISELLRKSPTDDGTFYCSIYELTLFIKLIKSSNDIKNGNTLTLEELEKEMEELYENNNRRFG